MGHMWSRIKGHSDTDLLFADLRINKNLFWESKNVPNKYVLGLLTESGFPFQGIHDLDPQPT